MIKKNIVLLLFALFLSIGSSMADGIPKKLAGTAPQTLPVTLISFTTSLEGEDIIVKWQTASETNSSHFNVQLSSGNEFKTIGTVIAGGTTNTTRDYQFFYPKTSYIPFLSVAALLLVSIGRPKKYLMFAALAFLMVVCFIGCEKDKPEEIHGVLYFRLEQVDLNGMRTYFDVSAINLRQLN